MLKAIERERIHNTAKMSKEALKMHDIAYSVVIRQLEDRLLESLDSFVHYAKDLERWLISFRKKA